MSENWTPFWFEGNQWSGFVTSPEIWKEVKLAYSNPNIGSIVNAENILDKSNDDPRCTSKPKYGVRYECDGEDTLRQFFERNNMRDV